MTDFLKQYREFLAEKPPLEELKNFCRKYKIRGFSVLKKKEIRDLIEKTGKKMDMEASKNTKHDTEMNAFFDDAGAKMGYKPPIKENIKQNKKDMEDFLMMAKATEKRTRKEKKLGRPKKM